METMESEGVDKGGLPFTEEGQYNRRRLAKKLLGTAGTTAEKGGEAGLNRQLGVASGDEEETGLGD